MNGRFWPALGDEMHWADMRSFRKASSIIVYAARALSSCAAGIKTHDQNKKITMSRTLYCTLAYVSFTSHPSETDVLLV